ncbi:MAG: protein kinase [Pirellulaceae bacterium]|nr:protein kinase [Pirellulaceae bacterium]
MGSHHLEEEQLNRLLLGQLGDAEQVAVESHLDECDSCLERAAATTPHDSVVELLSANESLSDAASSLEVNHDRCQQSDQRTYVRKVDSTSVDKVDAKNSNVESNVDSDRSSISRLTKLFRLPKELENHPRYRILRPLGRGGMGTVWLAQHLVMDRLVAIKVIRSERILQADAMERFRREIQAIAKLQHPNIVAAYDAEYIGDTLFLVVEYIDGETLSERLTSGPLPIEDACQSICDAARGLEQAHRAGIVHRDVKPGNLIQTRDHVVKILDFGLVVMPSAESSITGENMVVGTPDYVAPEQAEDARKADHRSDIYSLGCTLYHLLSGRPPFAMMGILGKLDSHRYESPPPINDIPDDLQEIVVKMMAKRPDNRFASASEVITALSRFGERTDHSTSELAEHSAKFAFDRRLAIAGGMGVISLAGWSLWKFGFLGANLNESSNKKEAIADVSSKTDSTLSTKVEGEGIVHPLLIPTTIGDGSRKNFSVEGNTLHMDAMGRNYQIWLNFKHFQARKFTIRADVRFVELGKLSYFKVSLLSDDGPEYNIQLKRETSSDWIFVMKAANRVEKLVSNYQIKDSLNKEWTNLEIVLDHSRLAVLVDQLEVLACVCDPVVSRYPAIAVLGCSVDILNPTAIQFD